jgi:hypothetical protein
MMWSVFATLAGLWAISAIAAGIWWLRGIEVRGMTLEAIAQTAG